MNKRIFTLLSVLLLLITLFAIKENINSKQELKKSWNNYSSTKEKINRIIYLQNKYSEKKVNFCNKKDNLLICNNLNKREFSLINRKIFKNDFPIKSFEIRKTEDKKVNLKVKIK